jgi:hypothetical protein
MLNFVDIELKVLAKTFRKKKEMKDIETGKQKWNYLCPKMV